MFLAITVCTKLFGSNSQLYERVLLTLSMVLITTTVSAAAMMYDLSICCCTAGVHVRYKPRDADRSDVLQQWQLPLRSVHGSAQLRDNLQEPQHDSPL